MEDNRAWLPWVLLACLFAGGGIFYYFFYRPATAPTAPPTPTESPTGESKAPPAPPNLEQGDALVRQRAGDLSTFSELAVWLKTENIVRRLTAATAIVAEGNSPRDGLDFLSPLKKFSVKKKEQKIYLDPRSYSRYDRVADVIQSLNVTAAAQLYQELKPVFESACQEQDCWKNGFQSTLVRAISELLRTPVVEGNIRLRRKVTSYLIMDNHLEGLSAAQKHLLRMGPKNAAKIQDKLREIARALGVSEDQLPKPQIYSPTIK